MTFVPGTLQLRLLTGAIRFLENRARKAAEAIARKVDDNHQRRQQLREEISSIDIANRQLEQAEKQGIALAKNLAGLTK
jgi:hypothetical protein